MEIVTSGGRLFIDGKEISLQHEGTILVGGMVPHYLSGVICSAGALYVSGAFVHEFTIDEFEQLKNSAK